MLNLNLSFIWKKRFQLSKVIRDLSSVKKGKIGKKTSKFTFPIRTFFGPNVKSKMSLSKFAIRVSHVLSLSFGNRESETIIGKIKVIRKFLKFD